MVNNEEQIRDSIKKLKEFIDHYSDHLNIFISENGLTFEIEFPNSMTLYYFDDGRRKGDGYIDSIISYGYGYIHIYNAEKEYLGPSVLDLMRTKGIVRTEEDRENEFNQKVKELDQFIYEKPEPPSSVYIRENSNERRRKDDINKEPKTKRFFKKLFRCS